MTEAKQSKKESRKKFLIYPRFQLNYLAHSLGSGLVVLLIFFGGNRFFVWRFMKKGYELGLPEDHVFFQFLGSQSLVLDLIYAVTGLAVLIFLFFHGLYLSHRVVGPLLRLQNYLKALEKEGSTSGLRFRKGDYFLEIAESLETSLRRIQQKSSPQKSSKGK